MWDLGDVSLGMSPFCDSVKPREQRADPNSSGIGLHVVRRAPTSWYAGGGMICCWGSWLAHFAVPSVASCLLL